MSQRYALVAMFALVAAACSERDSMLVYGDAMQQPQLDGWTSFLQPCSRDSECVGGHCIAFGGTKRCTRICSSIVPCPALLGWRCNGESLCECTPGDKQPNVCNVDGNCDGQPDKLPQAETCNGIDDDCNGEIDDVGPNTAGATLSYRDADGDGYGSADSSAARWLCQPKAGWVTRGGDCNDARKEDHPGAAEICGDTYDNDCDGAAEEVEDCGVNPPLVADVRGNYNSGELKDCGAIKILAKQDDDEFKFTLRLPGVLATTTCTTYRLEVGKPGQGGYQVYLYRPAGATVCGEVYPVEAFLADGTAISTSTFEVGNVTGPPGEAFFILNKETVLRDLPSPTYTLRACVNATADAVKDRSECNGESCETPVHR